MATIRKATIHFFVALAIGIIPPISANASGDCSSYPLTDGLEVEATDDGFKILATETAPVDLDNTRVMLQSMRIAESYAKARLVKFFNETIQVESDLAAAVQNEVKISTQSTSVNQETLEQYFRQIRESSAEILRGVNRVADCYTKGQYVKVTVGLKPDWINAAAGLVSDTAESFAKTNKAKANAASGTQGGASQTNDGDSSSFSNTSKLKDF